TDRRIRSAAKATANDTIASAPSIAGILAARFGEVFQEARALAGSHRAAFRRLHHALPRVLYALPPLRRHPVPEPGRDPVLRGRMLPAAEALEREPEMVAQQAIVGPLGDRALEVRQRG